MPKRGLSQLHHCSRHRGVDLEIAPTVGSFHLIFRLNRDEGRMGRLPLLFVYKEEMCCIL